MAWAGMPKAAVDEHRNHRGSKDDVWSPWEPRSRSKSEASRPEGRPKADFGPSVPSADSRHAAAALFDGHDIGHVELCSPREVMQGTTRHVSHQAVPHSAATKRRRLAVAEFSDIAEPDGRGLTACAPKL
jgi:hypothetical protein